MKVSEVFDRIHELDSRWERLRWVVTGPFLIALGVSQAIFAWAGNSLWMRIGYSAACITFGSLVIAFLGWLAPPDAEPETAENEPQHRPVNKM